MIQLLRQLINQSINSVSVKELFPTPPVVSFKPQIETCPFCSSVLQVRKTDTKVVYSLHVGKFIAHQTFLYCKHCDHNTIYSPEQLDFLTAKCCNFGYDVLVHVGKSIFQRYRTILEVTDELRNFNINISASEVAYLAKKFIVYLAISHRNIASKINEYIQLKGGFILHLDGTCEGSSPHLIRTLDELSKIVLGNIKIPTEKAELIEPLLIEIKHRHGTPEAIVVDMGNAMLLSVAKVFPGIKIFICHFHFLRDIGKDLLEASYAAIRNTLKKYGISARLQYRLRQLTKTGFEQFEMQIEQIIQSDKNNGIFDILKTKSLCYTLIIWTLDGKKCGDGYGFPFDRTHLEFYQRLCTCHNILKAYSNNKSMQFTHGARKIIVSVLNDLQALVTDNHIREHAIIIQKKIAVFEELRYAMQIAMPDQKEGLNDSGENSDIATIEYRVKQFRTQILDSTDYKSDNGYKKMIKQIDTYWYKLFADPITVYNSKGKFIIQPQRTNNIMEQFFRSFRRGQRRTSGNNSISQKLRSLLADTPLVKNLDNKEYMNILLNGKSSLEEIFSQIDYKIIKSEFEKVNKNEDRIPSKIKKIIKMKNLHELFINLQK